MHEATIGILQNTEATVRAAITALSNEETQTGLKKAAVSTAYTALQSADSTGMTTLTNGRLISVDSLIEPSASSTRLSFWKIGMCVGQKERGHSYTLCKKWRRSCDEFHEADRSVRAPLPRVLVRFRESHMDLMRTTRGPRSTNQVPASTFVSVRMILIARFSAAGR